MPLPWLLVFFMIFMVLFFVYSFLSVFYPVSFFTLESKVYYTFSKLPW